MQVYLTIRIQTTLERASNRSQRGKVIQVGKYTNKYVYLNDLIPADAVVVTERPSQNWISCWQRLHPQCPRPQQGTRMRTEKTPHHCEYSEETIKLT